MQQAEVETLVELSNKPANVVASNESQVETANSGADDHNACESKEESSESSQSSNNLTQPLLHLVALEQPKHEPHIVDHLYDNGRREHSCHRSNIDEEEIARHVAKTFHGRVLPKQPRFRKHTESQVLTNGSLFSHDFQEVQLRFEEKEDKLWLQDFDLNQRARSEDYFPTDKLYFLNNCPIKRVVFVDGKFQDVSNVDLRSETFNATIRMYCTWLASKEDLKSWSEREKNGAKWEPSWMPRFEMDNCVAKMQRHLKPKKVKLLVDGSTYSWLNNTRDTADSKSYLGFDARYGVWVRATFEFSGTFVEEYELQSFPFDCQDLKISLRCTNCEYILPLPTQEIYLSLNKIRTALSDFRIRRVTAEFGISSPDVSRGRRAYGQIIFVVKVSRYWRSRLDILLSEGVLTFLSLLVFSSPFTDLGNRLNYVMTVILTDVALQQHAKAQLHDFEYFTALDKFIWVSFLFKALVLIWVALPFFPLFTIDTFRGANEHVTNVTAAWIFTILYFVYMIWCFIHFGTIHHIEKRKLDKSVLEIEEEYNDNRNEYFALRLDDENMARFCETRKDGKPLRQWIQTGETIKVDYGLSHDDQYQLHSSDFEEYDIVFRLLSRKGVIVFLGVIALSIWGLYEGLKRNFPVEFAIIVLTCIIGNVLNWLWTSAGICSTILRNDEAELDKESGGINTGVTSVYYHNYWLHLSIITTATLPLTHGLKNYRPFVMNMMIGSWYGLIALFDLVYDMSSRFSSERFAARYIIINSKWPDDSGSLKRWSKIAMLFLKHVLLGANQAVQGIIIFLPVFVVEYPDVSQAKDVKILSWEIDVAAVAIFCVSAVLLVLSLLFWDSMSAWKENRTFRETFRTKCCCQKCIDNEDVEDKQKTPTSPLKPSEHNTHKRATSFRTDKWNDEINPIATDCMNPYRAIRYPVRLSEIGMCFSMWLLSTIVYKYGFLIGIIGVLSPVYIALYHAMFMVPLLDNLADHEFAETREYRRYKERTNWFSIEL